MNKDVRQTVWERCAGYCEFCGKPLDPETWDFHHRQLGTKLDLVVNGIACCHGCHLIGIHGNPQIARSQGFIISKYIKADEFSEVRLLLGGGENPSRGKWVTLTSAGTYAQISLRNDYGTGIIIP